MYRRNLIALTASALATSATITGALADESDVGDAQGKLKAALQRFMALPGTKSYVVHVGRDGSEGRIVQQPDLTMFIASGYKTFLLGQYLIDVEAERRSEEDQLAIDDTVRDFGSPVFENLVGTTTARSVMEAMMTHSDNTATNAATLVVGAPRVRQLIAQLGLRSTRIPDSSRIFEGYVFGAPVGVDLGWPGILQFLEHAKGPFRPLLNDRQTLASSAQDLVCWYELALSGKLFAKRQTVTEFKRIQAMSDQIGRATPADTLVYAKGGEAPEVNGFSAKCFAGQMIAGRTPVTFSFILNWEGYPGRFREIETEYFAAIKNILQIIKKSLT